MVLIIYNNLAGKGSANTTACKLSSYLISNNIAHLSMDINELSGYEYEKIIKNQLIESVLICGGDGTVNSVINKFIDYIPEATFGVIPCGYGNVISKSISTISIDNFLDNENIELSNKISKANDKYFLNIASIGLTAETVKIVEDLRKTKYGSTFYQVLGGIFFHVICFLFISFFKSISRGKFHIPKMKTWMKSNNKYSFFGDLRSILRKYFNYFFTNKYPVNQLGQGDQIDVHEYISKKDFNWQLDGEPQGTTKNLKILFNYKRLSIQTIQT